MSKSTEESVALHLSMDDLSNLRDLMSWQHEIFDGIEGRKEYRKINVHIESLVRSLREQDIEYSKSGHLDAAEYVISPDESIALAFYLFNFMKYLRDHQRIVASVPGYELKIKTYAELMYKLKLAHDDHFTKKVEDVL